MRLWVKRMISALSVGSVVAVAAAPVRSESRFGGPPAPAVSKSFGHGAAAYFKGDYATAIRVTRRFAEQGDAGAQHLLGTMYSEGHGVPQDYGQALKWYRLAAGQGYRDAQHNLGVSYENGEGVPQDYAEAIKWYHLAAAQGLAASQYNLGVLYANGEGVPQDYTEAIKWYQLAAAQGFDGAQLNLGVMYFRGQGVPQDYVQAHQWFNLATAPYLGSDPKTRDKAVHNRDLVAAKMTPAQVAEAQRLAREWKPK